MQRPDSWEQFDAYFSDIFGEPLSYTCCARPGDVESRWLPYLGNGFIATQPKSNWIFMDGLFSGSKTTSHRACIPSPTVWLAKPAVLRAGEDGMQLMDCGQTYWMHFGMGLFLQELHHQNFKIFVTTFISRRRPDLLVRLVEVHYLNDSAEFDEIVVEPDTNVILDKSSDCVFSVKEIEDAVIISGATREAESDEFQPDVLKFYMCTNATPKALAHGFSLSRSRPSRYFLTTLGRSSAEEAVNAFNSALRATADGSYQLFIEQAEEWRDLWNDGCIVLDCGGPDKCKLDDCPVNQMSHVIQVAQYSLLTCLPTKLMPPFNADPNGCVFYALCPTGLSRGNEKMDYMGHVFWDMELWMLPWINLFHPEACRLALDYRYHTLPAARHRARAENFEGARFPWESAHTGVETSPWDLSGQNEIHVVGGVSVAVQQWLLTHLPNVDCYQSPGLDIAQWEVIESPDHPYKSDISDEDWYRTIGRILLEEVARFWNSRMVYSLEKQAYEVLSVMPPDEYTSCCRNSSYTNAIAGLSLSAPATFARVYDDPLPEVYTEWEKKAGQIWMPRDVKNHLMLEHEDYKLGTCVKQADTVLLSFPLMYSQPYEWRRKMIDYYAEVTDPNGPAMTWCIFSICALDLDDFDRAADYFSRSLQHVQPHFYTWTETRKGTGASNFLTGVGGFLQSIVNGYLGLRIQLMDHKLITIDRPCIQPLSHQVATLHLSPKSRLPLPQTKQLLRLNSLHFQKRRLRIEADYGHSKIRLALVSGSPLYVGQRREGEWKFDVKLSVDEKPVQLDFQPLCIVPSFGP
ncbi:unnamed protein product [Calicophoron daubneyi]|uniref:Glycoside hydrolase family 65 central catalytic domain-containing protein n=1 Tax=Calicophoron daubneyi TaxID=300641 RepID=A0AAV2TZI5_CALDB